MHLELEPSLEWKLCMAAMRVVALSVVGNLEGQEVRIQAMCHLAPVAAVGRLLSPTKGA